MKKIKLYNRGSGWWEVDLCKFFGSNLGFGILPGELISKTLIE